jgi:hypothetical protein
VIVAVAAVRMVQVPRDDVVDMIAVRNRLVSASLGVDVSLAVPRARVRGGTGGGVRRPDFERALVDVAFVRVMQVPVVQVVDVASVPDGGVAATGSVNVVVMLVHGVAHGFLPFDFGTDVTNAASPAWSSAARINSRTCSSASE